MAREQARVLACQAHGATQKSQLREGERGGGGGGEHPLGRGLSHEPAVVGSSRAYEVATSLATVAPLHMAALMICENDS